jgi:uncharacterized membrane protein
MTAITLTYRSRVARGIFDLLNPISSGLCVGTLIFNVTDAAIGNVFWGKCTAWVVTTAQFVRVGLLARPRMGSPT